MNLDLDTKTVWMRRYIWLGSVALLIWLCAAWLIGSYVVTHAYNETGVSYIDSFIKNRAKNDVQHYIDYWNAFVLQSGLVFGGIFVFGIWLFSKHGDKNSVPPATAADLGLIRILTFGCLLANAIWEDPTSSTQLPDEVYHPVGMFRWLHALPGFESLIHDAMGMACVVWITRILLILAVIGWRSRITMPLGVLGFFIISAVLRSYSWSYHTGVLPLYLGAVLCLLPAGDGLSLDAKRRSGHGWRGSSETSPRYSWSRFACWTVLAVAFLLAGMSKVRNGGMSFVHPDNFRNILYSTTLTPMEFDFQISTRLINMPDWFFSGLAWIGLITQLSAIALPFSRRARLVIPVGFMFMHLGIWLLQNILFFEAIILQLVFYEWGKVIHHESKKPAEAISGRAGAASQLLSWSLVFFMGCIWLSRIEYFPLTGMQMFSRPTLDQDLIYYKVVGRFSDGSSGRAPIEKAIGATSDSRYRHILSMPFKGREEPPQLFFDAVISSWNRRFSESQQKTLETIELQRWIWNIHSQPVSGIFGEMSDSILYLKSS